MPFLFLSLHLSFMRQALTKPKIGQFNQIGQPMSFRNVPTSVPPALVAIYVTAHAGAMLSNVVGIPTLVSALVLTVPSPQPPFCCFKDILHSTCDKGMVLMSSL